MLLASAALAISPEALSTRLAEVAELRARRLGTEAPSIPADAYAKVAAGEVVTGLEDADGTKARKIWGVGIVEVPVDRFFSAINDERNKPAYSKLAHSLVLDGDYCAPERVVFQFMPVPLLTDRWWVIQQRINTAVQDASGGRVRELAWRPPPAPEPALSPEAVGISVQGMRVTHTYGGWFLVDLDGTSTLVEFWSWSDPGGNVPVRMASSLAAGSIGETFTSMGELARKGPDCAL
ncbi:MAG: hypothetical protein R3F61_25825 [Myxococcota bacterium]